MEQRPRQKHVAFEGTDAHDKIAFFFEQVHVLFRDKGKLHLEDVVSVMLFDLVERVLMERVRRIHFPVNQACHLGQPVQADNLISENIYFPDRNGTEYLVDLVQGLSLR